MAKGLNSNLIPLPKGPRYPEPLRTPRGWKHKYNILTPYALSPWRLELLCWERKFPTGLTPYYHFRRAAEMLFPDSAWHDWRETRFQSLCDDEDAYRTGNITIRNQSWVGPGAAAKTYDAVQFAFLFWLAAPSQSYVILTSTSKNKIKQRAWSVIQECYIATQSAMEDGDTCGHMLNSSMELQASKGDSRHSIFAQAVEVGEVAKAVQNLLGVHAPRICLVIDEAPGTPEAIFQTIPNMQKGNVELVVINIGNGPGTRLDCFSKVCTPQNGWDSVSVDMGNPVSDKWSTKGVPQYQLPPGVCHHFDGLKSPNVRAGKTIFPFLYTYENWSQVKDNPDVLRSVLFWQQDRGFWPPEGLVRTVLTEELITLGNARGKIEFDGATAPIGSVDPAFGGDKCILRFGKLGHTRNGKQAVQITECIQIPILVDATTPDGKRLPPEYQIAQFIQQETARRGVKPGHFGVEATGTGRGVASILTQEWGEIIRVESGGAPSDMPASEEDERPAKIVYDRRITELWFSVRAFVEGKQLGGLTEEDIRQFCTRLYIFKNKKYHLEKKEGGTAEDEKQKADLKQRLGCSPDEADAVAVMIEVARQHGMHTKGPRAERMARQWEGVQRQSQELYQEENLYQPEDAREISVSGPSWDPA